jgi:hypothetical protein
MTAVRGLFAPGGKHVDKICARFVSGTARERSKTLLVKNITSK